MNILKKQLIILGFFLSYSSFLIAGDNVNSKHSIEFIINKETNSFTNPLDLIDRLEKNKNDQLQKIPSNIQVKPRRIGKVVRIVKENDKVITKINLTEEFIKNGVIPPLNNQHPRLIDQVINPETCFNLTKKFIKLTEGGSRKRSRTNK